VKKKSHGSSAPVLLQSASRRRDRQRIFRFASTRAVLCSYMQVDSVRVQSVFSSTTHQCFLDNLWMHRVRLVEKPYENSSNYRNGKSGINAAKSTWPAAVAHEVHHWRGGMRAAQRKCGTLNLRPPCTKVRECESAVTFVTPKVGTEMCI
jgi:hypothetical protein